MHLNRYVVYVRTTADAPPTVTGEADDLQWAEGLLTQALALEPSTACGFLIDRTSGHIRAYRSVGGELVRDRHIPFTFPKLESAGGLS